MRFSGCNEDRVRPSGAAERCGRAVRPSGAAVRVRPNGAAEGCGQAVRPSGAAERCGRAVRPKGAAERPSLTPTFGYQTSSPPINLFSSLFLFSPVPAAWI